MNHQNKNIKQQIDLYVHGQLPAEETEELWAEIIQSEDYFDYLKTTADIKALEAPAGAVPDHYLRKLVYAGAAAVIILVTVFTVLKFTNTNPRFRVEPIATIELPFQRSANAVGAASEHETIIRKAVLLYYNNKLEEAVQLLQNEVERADAANWVAKLNITMGSFYYNENMFKQASTFFENVVSNKGLIKPLRLEKAYWYLANTRLRLSKFEKGRAALQKVININGAYSRVAKKYLNAMDEGGS